MEEPFVSNRVATATPPVREVAGVVNGAAVQVLWNRWMQLTLGVVAMVTISSPQYVWTLYTGPLTQALGVGLAQVH